MKLVASKIILATTAMVAGGTAYVIDVSILTHPIIITLASLSAIVGVHTAAFQLEKDNKIGRNIYTYFIVFKGFIVGLTSAPLLFLVLLSFGEQGLKMIGIEINAENKMLFVPIAIIFSLLFSRDIVRLIYTIFRAKENDVNNNK